MQQSIRVATLSVAIVFGLLGPVVAPANAQAQTPPQMRTRLLPSLTNQEVEDYLQRNDVIFVPVGPTETHGNWPLDCEYALPEAYAIKLAEKADGLVFPNLSYMYPGATVVGRGTVQTVSTEEVAYLKMLCRSLLHQGFKRIVFLTGHGPAPMTILPVVREMFTETKVSMYYLSVSDPQAAPPRPPEGASRGQRPSGPAGMDLALYGAYSIIGRLEDIPLKLEGKAPENRLTDPSLQILQRHSMSGGFGYYYADPADHGGVASGNLTAEQRAQFAKQGIAQIEETINKVDIKQILQALRDHNEFVRKSLVPKYGDRLPDR